MTSQFIRSEMLIGTEAMEKLHNARVAIFGVGGVGGYTAEALARSGVGSIDLIDNDTVSLSNINRQIIALHSTIGQCKVDVMASRIADINPDAEVNVHRCFFLPETAAKFDFSKYDYVVDAVDTVAAKVAIILACKEAGTPIISSMGAGNKLNPAMFEVADIYKTSVCPLARVIRQNMKKHRIDKLKVVYSKEIPLTPLSEHEKTAEADAFPRRATPGSMAFTPSVAGLILASEVVKDLIR